jgi:hypothetical protein
MKKATAATTANNPTAAMRNLCPLFMLASYASLFPSVAAGKNN